MHYISEHVSDTECHPRRMAAVKYIRGVEGEGFRQRMQCSTLGGSDIGCLPHRMAAVHCYCSSIGGVFQTQIAFPLGWLQCCRRVPAASWPSTSSAPTPHSQSNCALHCAVQCSAVMCSAVQGSAMYCSAVQCPLNL